MFNIWLPHFVLRSGGQESCMLCFLGSPQHLAQCLTHAATQQISVKTQADDPDPLKNQKCSGLHHTEKIQDF